MGYSAITQPHDYMAAYSAVPLKVISTNYNIEENFKYVINLTWDEEVISSADAYILGSNTFVKLTSTTPHNYILGDYLFLNQNGFQNDLYTSYAIIRKIVSSTEFVVDFSLDAPMTLTNTTTSRFIKYKFNPDLDGYAKMDFSNVLKDFVSQNLTGQSVNYGLQYAGEDTKFCYNINCGSEKNYQLAFEDNLFSGGSLGFYNSSITSLTNVPFQVGDIINVQQDLFGWAYNDNAFELGYVGFDGSTTPPFTDGTSLIVTGQITHPYYNGTSVQITTSTSNRVLIDKSFQSATSPEPGVIFGTPFPEYNGTCVIIEIFIDPTLGLVIITDKSFTSSSSPIGGNITYADGRLSTIFNELIITGDCVYNSHINQMDYSITAFDPYVIQNRAPSLNNLSTILTEPNKYRVEPSTIGFLLTHLDNFLLVTGTGYSFYDTNNTLLGNLLLTGGTGEDYYSPIGLEQIGLTTTANDYGTPFSGYSGSVDTYCVYAASNTGVTLSAESNSVCFKINNDCSKYEIYHLMWKDKYGSFISYPFIYVSRDNIEVDRKTYTQQDGSWDNDTFQYYDTGRGEKNFYLRSRKSIIVNSGWLYEFERDLIEDLIQSPSVYIQTPDNRLFSANLEEKKLEIYKNINEDLFSYSFSVITSSTEFRF